METKIKFSPERGESILINDNIYIRIKKLKKFFIHNRRVNIFFSAPKDIIIDREKIYNLKKGEKNEFNTSV